MEVDEPGADDEAGGLDPFGGGDGGGGTGADVRDTTVLDDDVRDLVTAGAGVDDATTNDGEGRGRRRRIRHPLVCTRGLIPTRAGVSRWAPTLTA